MDYARALCGETGLPLRFTSAEERLIPALADKIENLFPLKLQWKIQ